MKVFRFGPFELDPAAGQLRRSGILVKLAPQPFRVLEFLASRAGEPVTREEIRLAIWGDDTFVDFEQGINSCVKQIRHALGDPRYIETLPKRGYRFLPAEPRRSQTRIWFGIAAVFLCALCVSVMKEHFLPWSPGRALDLHARQQGVPPRLATANSEAFDSYLAGLESLSLRNEEGFRKALGFFRRAIHEDPHYALAYTGLADTYNLLGEYYLMPPAEVFPQAEEAARQALEIDDTLAEAHTSLAFATAKYEWNWAAAEAGFRRALSLNPGYATAHQWYAELLSGMGRHPQAIAEIRAARRLDPLSPIVQSVEGFIYYNARQYDRAISACRAVLVRDPQFLPAMHFLLLASERRGGRESAEIAALRRVYADAERHGERSVNFKRLLDREPLANPAPYSVAAGLASQGHKEQALAWLDRAYQRHDALLAYAKVDPNLDSLHGDPRFTAILKRVGLTADARR